MNLRNYDESADANTRRGEMNEVNFVQRWWSEAGLVSDGASVIREELDGSWCDEDDSIFSMLVYFSGI